MFLGPKSSILTTSLCWVLNGGSSGSLELRAKTLRNGWPDLWPEIFPLWISSKRQISKPRPVDAADMEAIFKLAKEEKEKADQSFLEEHQGDGSLNSEKLAIASPSASVGGEEFATVVKPRGKSRKATKPPVGLPSPGLTVNVVSGAFAGFSGVLKKLNKKTGLVTVGFTLFGKETLADLDLKDITAEMD